MKLIVLAILVWLSFNRFPHFSAGNLPQLDNFLLWPFLLALLLVLPNYYMEYVKWKLTLKQSQTSLSSADKLQSFFAGIITGMLTPNMQGNFIGRIYYIPRSKRISNILLTLVGNFGQFITTVFMGLFSIFLHQKSTHQLWIPLLLLLFSIVFYFNFEKINIFQRKWKWYRRLRAVLQKDHSFRWSIIGYSLLRNLVFSLQFLLVLYAFGAAFSWNTYFLIWTLYLYTTLSPSLFLGKLVIRESIAVLVLLPLELPVWNIVMASLLIWVMNLLLPTVTGLFICKRIAK